MQFFYFKFAGISVIGMFFDTGLTLSISSITYNINPNFYPFIV